MSEQLAPDDFRQALNQMTDAALGLLIVLHTTEEFVLETQLARSIDTNAGRGLSRVLSQMGTCIKDAGDIYKYRAERCLERRRSPYALRLRDHLRPALANFLDTERGKRLVLSMLINCVRRP